MRLEIGRMLHVDCLLPFECKALIRSVLCSATTIQQNCVHVHVQYCGRDTYLPHLVITCVCIYTPFALNITSIEITIIEGVSESTVQSTQSLGDEG